MSTICEELFKCSKEEFKSKLEELMLGADDSKALNFNIEIMTSPVVEKTKGGIIFTDEAKDIKKAKNCIGRVVSRGSAVGEEEELRDLKDLEIGDYVSYHYYAAGTPWQQGHVDLELKVFADDMVKKKVSQKYALAQVYV